MLKRFASTTFVLGTLLTASIPVAGWAQNRGNRSGGDRSYSRGSSGNSRGQSFGGGSRYTGGPSYSSPRGYMGGGYSRGPGYYSRGYAAPRAYPMYRRPYGGGVYLRFGVPYGYAYDPGYVYDPGYAYGPPDAYAPVPAQQGCPEGAYDRNGVWVPDPSCYSNQPVPPAQQGYDPYQPQDGPPQYYDPNAQRYPQQPQQNYVPNQPQRYNR